MSMANALARDALRRREGEFRAADMATVGRAFADPSLPSMPHTTINNEPNAAQAQLEAAARERAAAEQAERDNVRREQLRADLQALGVQPKD